MKKLISRMLICILIVLAATPAAMAEENQISIMIDDEEQVFDASPFIEKGRVLVPMRGIFETLDAEVEWDEENRTIEANKEGIQIIIEMGSYFAKINDKTTQLDVKPVIVEGRTMVPLRFISEALGAEVLWDDINRAVTINTEVSMEVDPKEAEENSDDTGIVLTYEEALDKALNNSYDYKAVKTGLEKAEEKDDNITIPKGYYNPVLIQGKKGSEVARQWAEKQVQLTEEAIEYSVENSMKELKQLLREKDLKEKKLEHSRSLLKIMELKAQTGMESEYNLTVNKQNYEQEEKELEVLNTSINTAYTKLNETLGMPKDVRYDVDIEISYNPTEELDIDHAIRKELSSNPQIWYQEKTIELKELGVELYEYNFETASYKEKEIDAKAARIELASLKSNLEKIMNVRYDQIKQIEENYKVLEINLEKAQQGLDLVRTQYDVGMAIETQLREAELAVEEILFKMDDLALQHEQLVKLLEKPYLSPRDYM